jgi:hypothetical protein
MSEDGDSVDHQVSEATVVETSACRRFYTHQLPATSQIPQSYLWQHIKENVHEESDPILRALPYFGDDDDVGVDVSDFDQIPGEIDLEIVGEAEELLIVYMLNRHKGVDGFPSEVSRALEDCLQISNAELMKAYDRIMEGEWFRNEM